MLNLLDQPDTKTTKMHKSILRILFLLLLIQNAEAQCPTTAFTMPDSICAGQTFQLVNTSTTGLNYQWDLCNGDLSKVPTGQNLGNIGPLTFPQQIKPVTDNGKYFIFIANYINGNLLRYDFGTSFNNTPVVYNYGGFGGLLNQPIAMDVVQDGSTWYALVANNSNKKVTRINLGTLIEANVASATDLGLFNLNNPKNLRIARGGGNFHAFVTNDLGNDLIRIDFGNSVANTPTGFTALNDPLFVSGWGFDISYDCIQNKYVGFFISYLQSKVQILDFGNSLANTPVISGSITTGANPSGAQLIRDGQNWHLLLALFGLNQMQNFKIGTSLLNTPVSVFADTVGGIKSPQCIAAFKDSSRFYAFTTNTSPSSFTRIMWPEPCTSNPVFSTDPAGITAAAGGGGFQSITLTATDASGNSNTYTDSIYVSPTPSALFVTSPACQGLPVQFTDSSSISPGAIGSWSWDFGDGSSLSSAQNPSHSYSGNGTFNVTLTATSTAGCSDSYSDSVSISPVPVADFSFTNNQCEGAAVALTDLSQAFGTTSIVNWTWDFGDGTLNGNIQNAIHVYDTTGTFTIKLVVETNSGCLDSITKTITIIPAPVADFSTSSTCIGEVASFVNLTTIQSGGTLSYSWNFGDGGTSALTNPVHQYTNAAGNYNVQLIATAANGCKDTLITNIRIANKPTPQFSWTPLIVCEGNQVTFNNTSTGNGGDTIATYLWNFGDLTSSTDTDPFHVYADTGSFTVTLTAVSPTDCDSSVSQQVTVIPGPSATFTFNKVCLGIGTTFNPSVITPPGTSVDSIVWDFGDGTTFTGLSSPIHGYLAPGTYAVSMTAYNSLLCTGTYTDSVEVYPLPAAAFTTSNLCSNSTTLFDGTTSSVANDTITGWLWNFDGLGTATGATPDFVFSDSGSYDVTLIVSTIHGCTDTTVSTISVLQSPEFDFTFTEPCLGAASQFNYISSIQPAPAATLLWNFGDGNLSSLETPAHIYAIADTFNVSLQVTYASNQCSANLEKMLIIKPNPVTGFSVAANCMELPLNFIDTSTVETGSISSWNWDFGTLGSDTVKNPVVVAPSGGVYPVVLSVTTNEGCTGIYTGSVTVFEKPVAAFEPDPLYGSPPLTVNFINTSQGATTFTWEFGDGSNGTGDSPLHVYQDTGSYAITMIAISDEGCRDTTSASIAVLIPKLDLAVTKVFKTQQNGLLNLSAEIANIGNVLVTGFDVTGEIENGSVIVEKWEGELAPGEVLNYHFEGSYEVADGFLPGYFCISATNPLNETDIRPDNNRKCSVLGSEFEIFSAYPNPFDNELVVNFNLSADDYFDLVLYDDGGKLVLQKTDLKGKKGFNTARIDTRTVSKGSYTFVIRFRDDKKAISVLKLR